MSITVRTFRAGDTHDAAGAAAVTAAAVPYLITTPEVVAWQVSEAPAAQRYRVFVAEAGREIVGVARTGLFHESTEPGQAFANVNVHPDRIGQGAGSALLRAAEPYLAECGARTIYSWTLDEPHSVSFAESHGYQRSRSAHFQRLDLASAQLPPLAVPPPDVTVITAAAFADDPRPLYEADAEILVDEPSDVTADALGYDDWLATTWNHPSLDHDLTSVVLVDGVIAAFSLAETDGRSKYWSGMTGTRRAFRGRGLAKLAKNDSLHRAKAAGITEAFTGNDTENGPMLAINRWFGYRPAATEWRYFLRQNAGPGEK